MWLLLVILYELALPMLSGGEQFNFWMDGRHNTDWEWLASGSLLSATYVRWANGQPTGSTGYVVMSQAEDFAFIVESGAIAYNNYFCETGEINSTACPFGFGTPISTRCYRLGWWSVGKTWTDTRDACQSLGAELLATETKSEYDFIYFWLTSIAPALPTDLPTTNTQQSETMTATDGATSAISTPDEDTTSTTKSTSSTQASNSLDTVSTGMPVSLFTTSILSSSITPSALLEDSYTYVTCYVSPLQTQPVVELETSATTIPSVQGNATPSLVSVETVNEFDPATQPDMAIIPASIGLTAMVVLAIFMGGIVVLDLASLKRDCMKFHRNVRHACKKDNSVRTKPSL